MKNNFSSTEGFALVECLVAVALLTIALAILTHSQQTALHFTKISALELNKLQSSRSAISNYLAKQLTADSREIFSVQNSKILGSLQCQPLLTDQQRDILTRCKVSFSDAPEMEQHFVQ